jgi:hypothetical protein
MVHWNRDFASAQMSSQGVASVTAALAYEFITELLEQARKLSAANLWERWHRRVLPQIVIAHLARACHPQSVEQGPL